MADRLTNNPKIADGLRLSYSGNQRPILIEKEIEAPMHLRKPARIGVQFMGDIAHEDIRDHDFHDILHVIEECPQHTFMVITKRIHRLSGLIKWERCSNKPLPNLWLGVSVENQAAADERIPILLQIPAAVRWLSVEPMLGPIDITRYLYLIGSSTAGPFRDHAGKVRLRGTGFGGQMVTSIPSGDISWVVVGGETGPGARPIHPDWVRNVRDECLAAGVPFYFKQWGEWCPATQAYGVTGSLLPETDERFTWIGWDGKTNNPSSHGLIDPVMAIGKMRTKRVGHLLDGQEYRQMPSVRAMIEAERLLA
jgi:protein gp37